MAFKSAKCACKREIVLNSKECIDTILQPLTKYIEIPMNGSLTTKDLFNTIIGMSVKNLSVHSASSSYQNTPCETSVRYHLKKLNLEELTAINEKILTHSLSNFLKPGRRYRFAIDFTDEPYYGRNIPFRISVDVKYMMGKRGKNGCENLAFVVYGIKWSHRKITNVYRTRFAIESSYRMRNIVKPKTSTKDVTVRYLYALISFLMKNAWLYLQKKHFTAIKQGPPVVEENSFRFDMFIILVEGWIRNKLKIRTYVECIR